MERKLKSEPVVLTVCVGAFCIAMGLREELNVWIGTGAAAVTSIVLLSFGARGTLRSIRAWPSAGSVATGIAIGIAMSLATWWFYPLSVAVLAPVEGEVETLYAVLRQPPGPIRAFPLLLLVVAAEELVWRGLAIDLFSKALGPSRAVLLSALLYMLPQIAFRSPLLIVVAALCGLLWGTLRVRFHGLAAPFTAHLVWDVLVFIMYPVA